MHSYKTLRDQHGGIRPAARALGIPESTFRDRLKAESEIDPAIQNSMDVANTNMIPSMVWIKNKTHSIQLKPQVVREADFLDRLQAAFENLPVAREVPAPLPAPNGANLLTIYPIFDAHFGMLADTLETGGAAYDLDRAATDIRNAFNSVMGLSPDSDEAIILMGGDTLHADDTRNQTPANKHHLDVAARHYRVLAATVDLMGEMVEKVLRKHQRVTVRVLEGNHDPHAHIALHMGLKGYFRENPRVTVEDIARDLFMFRWGKVTIFSQHGHKAPDGRMALYLSDICPWWSETPFRHIFTGHVHHDQVKNLGPILWESLPAFCPPDAYASSHSYGGRRGFHSCTFHKDRGLILRAIDPILR